MPHPTGIPNGRTSTDVTRRIIAVALLVLGAVAVALAVASATVWRPTDNATLTTPARPEAPVVISEPGVLDAVAPEVTITAQADDGQPVVLAIGRTEDVEAWVGPDAHERITGLSSWEELSVEPQSGAEPAPAEEGAAEEAPAEETATGEAPTEGEPAAAGANPAGSDLWVAQSEGTGTTELGWTHEPGRWSLIAATDGTAPAPQISLTWPREVRTPWLVPGLVAGSVLLLAGAALLALALLGSRRRRPVTAAAPAGSRTGAATPPRPREDAAATAELPAAGVTRRQLREHGRAGRAGDDVTTELPAVVERAGAARGAAVVPGSSHAGAFRQRRAGAAEPQPAEPATDRAGATGPEAAGVARGVAVVPASERAAEFRRQRLDAPAEQPDPTETTDPQRPPQAGDTTEGQR